jgi:thiol:disulfide interchange protein DsbC
MIGSHARLREITESAVTKRWILVPVAVLMAGSAAVADDDADTRAELAKILKGVDIEDIVPSPVDGIYQVSINADVAYVSSDGRFLMQGELYDLKNSENLTEKSRAARRVDLLAAANPEAIVFSPKDGQVKHTITVFTDVDCGYCRQFHREIDKVNALGIEVHYLFYPRTGPDTESWYKAERVWCAKDRNAALTQAKQGGKLPEADCGETPVAADYELGHRVGVTGTPAIFAENGEQVGGYLPPDTLAEKLDSLAEDAPAEDADTP